MIGLNPFQVSPNLDSRIYRMSVDQYHRMIETGTITEDDHVELIEGVLMAANGHNPPHDSALTDMYDVLKSVMAAPVWVVRQQMPITLDDSEPEPDVVVAHGPKDTYRSRHPGPNDVVLACEVADSSLTRDRTVKGSILARNSIPCFWIVNVNDRCIEVYTGPSGPVSNPHYSQRQDYPRGSEVPVIIQGREMGRVNVDEIVP